MPRKSIKETASNVCSFCTIKQNELEKKNGEIMRLETKLKTATEGKQKKELTEEEKASKQKERDERMKQREEKLKEYQNTINENKKLKAELLTRFGVDM